MPSNLGMGANNNIGSVSGLKAEASRKLKQMLASDSGLDFAAENSMITQNEVSLNLKLEPTNNDNNSKKLIVSERLDRDQPVPN